MEPNFHTHAAVLPPLAVPVAWLIFICRTAMREQNAWLLTSVL